MMSNHSSALPTDEAMTALRARATWAAVGGWVTGSGAVRGPEPACWVEGSVEVMTATLAPPAAARGNCDTRIRRCPPYGQDGRGSPARSAGRFARSGVWGHGVTGLGSRGHGVTGPWGRARGLERPADRVPTDAARRPARARGPRRAHRATGRAGRSSDA